MYNRKRRLADRQLIKIMETHLVTKARNLDERERKKRKGKEEEKEAEETELQNEKVSLWNSSQ
jgi:hypothetical protein